MYVHIYIYYQLDAASPARFAALLCGAVIRSETRLFDEPQRVARSPKISSDGHDPTWCHDLQNGKSRHEECHILQSNNLSPLLVLGLETTCLKTFYQRRKYKVFLWSESLTPIKVRGF